MALCWAGYEEGKVDLALFCAFLEGYFEQGGKIPVSWEVLYDCNNMRLQWLEYNLKRAFWLIVDKNEQKRGKTDYGNNTTDRFVAEIKEENLEGMSEKFLTV